MAGPILQKSLPKEPNKSESKLDPEICRSNARDQLSVITEPIHIPDRLTPTIKAVKTCYLPGNAGYLGEILEETVSNLTHLHKCLSEIAKMLVKGGER